MTQKRHNSFAAYPNIYFIGIGGIGISALARILKAERHRISGSDPSQTTNTSQLEKEGITVHSQQIAETLPLDTDLVIYTAAIRPDNPQFQKAQSLNLKMLSYPQAVGLLTQGYKTICIAGTHGKTTTTAMLALALEANNQDPTAIIGGLIKEFGNKNERLGQSDLFVLESCEYQDSYLNYSPFISVINNIDPEHFDYFGNAGNYLKSFEKFINKTNPKGFLIVNGDDENISTVLNHKPDIQVITFGVGKNNDFIIQGHKILFKGQELCTLNLSIPGEHNLRNATVSIIISKLLDLDLDKTIDSLNKFQGAGRRFEIKGQLGETTIMDDYAHTPTEIIATLSGLREKFGQDAKILCIFQPHQYSRTYAFLEQFAKAFDQVDQVMIPNIYQSRDTAEDLQRISPEILVERINAHRKNTATHTENFTKTLQQIKEVIKNYQVIITIGAGDITKLSDDILKQSN